MNSSHPFDFVSSFLFAHSPTCFFFFFAKSYKGSVKCAHDALSKKSIASLKHRQKNYFAFAVSCTIGPMLSGANARQSGLRGPGGGPGVGQPAGTACAPSLSLPALRPAPHRDWAARALPCLPDWSPSRPHLC